MSGLAMAGAGVYVCQQSAPERRPSGSYCAWCSCGQDIGGSISNAATVVRLSSRQARQEIAATQDHDHLSWETDQVLHEATSLLQGFGETDGLNSKAQLMLQRHLTQETLVALSRTDFS